MLNLLTYFPHMQESLYLIYCVYLFICCFVFAVQNTKGFIEIRPTKKKERTDLVFLKAKEDMAIEQPKLCFPAQQMRTDCLNLCGMSLYFIQWILSQYIIWTHGD